MRKRWKEVGLGTLNLLAIILVIAAVQPVLRKHLPNAIGGTVLAMLVLATYVAGSKWLERRAPSELDIHRSLPEVAFGLVLGFVLFAISMAILWAAGFYHPVRGGTSNGLVRGMAAAFMAGVLEEIVFRGLLFRLCSKVLGTWGALLFSAALFGAAHSFNRGATISSSIAIAIEAGVLLGAAYAATQSLWVPIGLHIGWKFHRGFDLWYVSLRKQRPRGLDSRFAERPPNSHRRTVWARGLHRGSDRGLGSSVVLHPPHRQAA